MKSLALVPMRSQNKAIVAYSANASLARTKELTPGLRHVFEEVQREIGLTAALSVNEQVSLKGAEQILDKVAARLGFEISTLEKDELLAQLEREARPFGALQDLVDNPEVSDIIVSDYCSVSIQRGRVNSKTSVSFSSQASYEAFVEKLLFKAQATYSVKNPIADGMIGQFARIHVVHKSLCDAGPYLTIRLNRFSSVGLADLANNGLAPDSILAYLAGLLRIGKTVLLVGETGTGKTTLARALAAQVPAAESILVIEDTQEIKLEHPHVRYISTREANSEDAGRITPSQCIRAGMRMAMNRIIFGEIRDAEAAEAFIDVCASGHPGLSTIHARSAIDALTRLELLLGRAQKGVGREILRDQIATAVQVVVHLGSCHETGTRRILEVVEFAGATEGTIRHRPLFKYAHNEGPKWSVLTRVSIFREDLERIGISLTGLAAQLELKGGNSSTFAAMQKEH